MKRRLGNEAGFISLKALFWLLLTASALYGAYKFVPPYLGFMMLKIDLAEEAKVAHMYSDEDLAGRIIKKAAAWSIPLDDDSLFIERGRDSISISVYYTVRLDFFDRYEKTLVYDIEVQAPLKETVGALR